MQKVEYGTKEDHPHAYGDKLPFYLLNSVAEGSSPRVWGQVIVFPPALWAVRIIPTRMGTSQMLTSITGNKGDHPHAYGDKPLVRGEKLPTLGSSPRVWGQVLLNMIYLQ